MGAWTLGVGAIGLPVELWFRLEDISVSVAALQFLTSLPSKLVTPNPTK